MPCAGEHVYAAGALGFVASGGEAFGVAGQGGAVAGDVNYPLRAHGGAAVERLLAHALARRVDDDGVRPLAHALIARGGLGGVGADELDVFNAVAARVRPRVLNRLGHYLSGDDALRPAREAQAYRARAAVELEDLAARLGQGEIQRDCVKPLGLRRIDLVKGLRRNLKLAAAERVHQLRAAPERPELPGEDGVAPAFVQAEHDARELRTGGAQRLDQRGRLPPEAARADHAADRRAVSRGAREHVPDGALAAVHVVGRDAAGAHPVPHGGGEGVGARILQKAALHADNLVRARAEEAGDGRVRRPAQGEDGLVAVAIAGVGADYILGLELEAAYAPEGVVDLPELEAELGFIAHVQAGAAAAAAEGRAGALAPLGRGLKQLLSPAVHDGAPRLHNPDAPELAGQRAAREDRAAADAEHAERLARQSLAAGLVYFVFPQFVHADIVSRPGRICNAAAACARAGFVV